MVRTAKNDNQAPHRSARYGIGMVLLLVAGFALLFAVVRAAGEQWATVVVGFLGVFATVAFFSVLGVIADVVQRKATASRVQRLPPMELEPPLHTPVGDQGPYVEIADQPEDRA